MHDRHVCYLPEHAQNDLHEQRTQSFADAKTGIDLGARGKEPDGCSSTPADSCDKHASSRLRLMPLFKNTSRTPISAKLVENPPLTVHIGYITLGFVDGNNIGELPTGKLF